MAERGELHLGDEVKDDITGFAGIVIAITQWLNGCERIILQSKELKDGKPVEAQTFDTEQLSLVTRRVKSEPVRKTGGPCADAAAAKR